MRGKSLHPRVVEAEDLGRQAGVHIHQPEEVVDMEEEEVDMEVIK